MTTLAREYNNAHPKFTLERVKLRAAMQARMESRHIASPGHFVRWRVNAWGELESERGRYSE